MKTFLQIFLLVYFISFLHSQSVTQLWVSRYINPFVNNSDVRSMAIDSSGNIFIGGYIDKGNYNTSYLTIKYNSSGVQQWAAIYDGPVTGYDDVRKIAVDNQGNVIVTGASKGIGYADLCTIKYNSSGMQQWVARYNLPTLGQLLAADMKIDNLGNIYIIGINGMSGPGITNPAFLAKYNSSGVQQWISFYDYPNQEEVPTCMLLDNSGYIYVAGHITLFEASSNFLLKYNLNGDTIWTSTFAWAPNYSGTSINYISLDGSGNINLAGTKGYYNGFYYLYWYQVYKFTPGGINSWNSSYSMGMTVGEVYALATDSDGSSYIAGTQGRSINIIKYNSSGVQQWLSNYVLPAEGNLESNLMLFDSVRNLYVSGSFTIQNDTNGADALTFCLEPSGIKKWEIQYKYLNYNESPTALILDRLYNVIITGTSGQFLAPKDIFTVKYGQFVNTKSLTEVYPIQFSLSQNYPNPFNPSTKIKIEIPLSRGVDVPSTRDGRGVFAQLIIYNSLGQQIASLVNQQLQPGTYEVEWNASGYPSGIYFYALKTESFNQTKRMVLVK